MPDTVETIRSKLTSAFTPSMLEIRDDSAAHASHKGARKSGGGHYEVVIESERFRGKSLLEQHRMVNDALKDEFGPVIHALAIRTRVPAGQ